MRIWFFRVYDRAGGMPEIDETFMGVRFDTFAKVLAKDELEAREKLHKGDTLYMPPWTGEARRKGNLSNGIARLRCPSE